MVHLINFLNTQFTIVVFFSADVASLRNPFKVVIMRLASTGVTMPDNFSSNNFESISVNPSDEDDDDFSFEDDDEVLFVFCSSMLSLITFFHSASVKVDFLSLMARYNSSVCTKKMKIIMRIYFNK